MRLNTDEPVVIVLDGGKAQRIAGGNCNLSTLEDMLMERLDSDDTGTLDGSECGPGSEQHEIRLPGKSI